MTQANKSSERISPYHGALRSPRNLVFGAGQRAALSDFACALGTSVLVVTDERLAATAEFNDLMSLLRQSSLTVSIFSGVAPELPLECILDGVRVANRSGADLIIGIGGGSCMDAAKAIAVLVSHDGQLSDYYGEHKVPGPVVPVIALPTTSGTGSEVTPVAVISDPERTLKIGIASPYIIPHTAICDPELTYTCPQSLTAHSGADALTHAIEAFTAARREWPPTLVHKSIFVGKNIISDHYALQAIGLLASNLKDAYDGIDNERSRANVMLGATMAGLAFGTAGTAAAHALQYPIGATTGTPHGLGVAAMLPYVMAFNRRHCMTEMAQISVAMCVEIDGRTDEEATDLAISAVEDLFGSIGIPKSIAALGFKSKDIDQTVQGALGARRLIDNNPRPVDAASLSEVVRAALLGDRARLNSI